MFSLKTNNRHVRRTGPNIFGGDVTSFQRLNETSVRTQQCSAITLCVVGDDDRLAASEWQTGECVLVSHALRQAQCVRECFVFAFVMPEACAADGWTKRCAMDRDDAVI